VNTNSDHLVSASAEAATAPLKVKVYPYRKGRGMGNIIWAERNLGSAYYRVSRFAMNGGKFPASHPVGGGHCDDGSAQCGSSDAMTKFRERGYWASCFPEGDGITWEPKAGQSDEQCLADIRECFGWDAMWARGTP
jgi:hypothetical protein